MTAHTYASYANSGVAWIGAMPAHWDVSQIRYQARLESGHTPSRSNPDFWKNCHIPWFTLADVWQIRRNGQRVVTETDEKISDLGLRHSSARLLPEGSVILSRTASVGFPAILGIPMAVSQDFAVWTCGHRLNNHFLWYVLQAMRGELHRVMMGSTHQTIYMGDIEQFQTPLPPKYEQQVIVDFLDHETARIDALIEEQKRLAGLLQEKRTVTVSTAVTKGLEPSVRMKDSLVSYLGNVPNHWNLVPLRYLVTEPLEYGANESAEEENPSHPRFIRITDFDDSGNLRSETFKSLPWEVARPYLLKEGDILLARSGATVGKAFIYSAESGPACYAGYLIRARPDRKKIDPDFLSRYLRSAQYWEYINSVTIQATIQNVSAERYGNVLVPVPPLDEQKEILRHLDFAEKNEERLLTEARSGISLLQERRAALVSAAVTGKIDVREWEHSTPSTEEALPQAAEKEGRYG